VTWKQCILVALGVLSVSAPAGAQYFGRNKVQYDRFDFSILQTPHFDIYYYDAEKDAARIAADMAERWYARLSVALDHTFDRRQPVILYASHAHFAQTSIISESIADGIGGFTDHLAGRVVLPFTAGLGETDHVLGHELVHAFQRDILKTRGRSLALLPLWFAEGMAEYLSVHELDVNTKMWLRDAAQQKKLPTIAQLDDPKYFPYRYGQALWAFLAHEYGESVVLKALQSRANGGATGRLKDATGKDAATLSAEWHSYIEDVTGVSDDATTVVLPKRVIGYEQNGGRMNVAPSVSPDGKQIVFLSERDGYSVDVFVADAATGVVQRKLLSSAADAHFDSLQFIDSAGAWDAAGRSFVLATLRDGRPALTIFDMVDHVVRQEIGVPAVDQIFSPTWSPDGRRIAFSAMTGGFTDLFFVDVATGALHPLTHDAYSDLQPSWSSDGRQIVFATDRFSSSLSALSFGRYQLATLDVASRSIQRVGGLSGGKNIDPHWSADDASIYFVSDAGGASNVYRYDTHTHAVARVTMVDTGVSGITALSPAISLSRDGKLALSVYAKGMYEIRTLTTGSGFGVADSDLLTAAEAPELQYAEPENPEPRNPENPELATPNPVANTPKPYVPRLSLAQLGSPYLSAGGGAFGSFLRAGVSVAFGDMLGQQELDTAIQVGKETTDNAVVSTYLNRQSRLNWGISGGRIPALVGASDRFTRTIDAAGNDVFVHQTDVLQQIHRQGAAMVAYPFNRAERIEGSVGVDMIGFDARTTTTTIAVANGATLSDDTTHRAGAPSATMIQTGAAWVYDTSVFGPASPVLGARFRFAFAPAFGDLSVLTTVVDARRYFMPLRPLTLAVRGQGVARSGADANDARLLPLIWNMRDVVRGFDTDNDTVRTARFAVANVELRAPLVGLVHRDVNYGALPIEALVFGDCGRFWMPTSDVSTLTARTLCSAGAGARINAAGLIFEFDAVRPFGVSSDGWRIGINFLPGF